MKKFMALSLAAALSLSSVFAADSTQSTVIDPKGQETPVVHKPKKQEKLNRIRNISALSTAALIALAHYLSNKGMLPNVSQNAISDQNLVMNGPLNTPEAREGFEYLSTSFDEETPSWKTLFPKGQPPVFQTNEQNIAPLQVDTALLAEMASVNPAAADAMVNFYKEKYPSLGWLSTQVEDSIQEHLDEVYTATTPEAQKALLDTLVREVVNNQTISCYTPAEGFEDTSFNHRIGDIEKNGVLCYTDNDSYNQLLKYNETGALDNLRTHEDPNAYFRSAWLGDADTYLGRSYTQDQREVTKIVIQDLSGQAYEETLADLMKADAKPVIVSKETAAKLKGYRESEFIPSFTSIELPNGSFVVSLNQEPVLPAAQNAIGTIELTIHTPDKKTIQMSIADMVARKINRSNWTRWASEAQMTQWAIGWYNYLTSSQVTSDDVIKKMLEEGFLVNKADKGLLDDLVGRKLIEYTEAPKEIGLKSLVTWAVKIKYTTPDTKQAN